MGWDQNEVTLPRRKLRIGATGTVGGSPSINSSTEAVDAFIEGRSLVEIQNELGSRGVVSEVPIPTYGYMGKDEFYQSMLGEGLINDWAIGA